MTHRAAGSISFFLYQKGMIEKDDMDIYQYGFEIFIDSFLEIIMLLLLGILWRKLPETVAFVGTFAILQVYGWISCFYKNKMRFAHHCDLCSQYRDIRGFMEGKGILDTGFGNDWCIDYLDVCSGFTYK